jgi:hypothetical protein
LSGERRTTPRPRFRTVDHVLNTSDSPDASPTAEPARWSIAGTFLEGLTTRDYQRLATSLDSGVRFRALLPPGPSEWHGHEDAADVFRSWFGDAERFEVVDATVGEIAGRLQMTWRIRLRPAPFDIGDGWHLIEQHAFADITNKIEALDLVCSGFRAQPTTT